MNKIKAIVIFCFLSACQFDVTPTFYVRDIQDVIEAGDTISVPLVMSVPASSLDECQSEIGQVLGILQTFGIKGEMQSCSTDENNIFAVARIELEAAVMSVEDPEQDRMKSVLALGLEQNDDGSYGLYIAANQKLEDAMNAIEAALVFASLDGANVGFIVTLNNDTRKEVSIFTYDSFVNGAPYDSGEFALKPRSELNIRASDVGTNLFFNRGWYEVGSIVF